MCGRASEEHNHMRQQLERNRAALDNLQQLLDEKVECASQEELAVDGAHV